MNHIVYRIPLCHLLEPNSEECFPYPALSDECKQPGLVPKNCCATDVHDGNARRERVPQCSSIAVLKASREENEIIKTVKIQRCWISRSTLHTEHHHPEGRFKRHVDTSRRTAFPSARRVMLASLAGHMWYIFMLFFVPFGILHDPSNCTSLRTLEARYQQTKEKHCNPFQQYSTVVVVLFRFVPCLRRK